MKVVLNNEKIYDVSLVALHTENELCIGFTDIKSYDELREDLTSEALSVIKYYPADNIESFDTYEDYTEFVRSSVTENESGTFDVAMYFKKVDLTTKILQEMYRQIDVLKEKNQYLQETVDTLVTRSLER